MCEKLEERLKAIRLQDLSPSLELDVIDIGDLSETERGRYDLEVPIMKIDFKHTKSTYSLPRVSPRIGGQELFRWLQREINKLQKAT